MNIFKLDNDISLCAQYHVDKHVVKMPLEYAQLLCSARHILGESPTTIPYKLTHKNHPCAIWTRASSTNYKWLVELGLAVSAEYTYRYGKTHGCAKIIVDCLDNIPKFDHHSGTELPLAMLEEYKVNDTVTSYRAYINGAKQHLFSWKNRAVPDWIIK